MVRAKIDSETDQMDFQADYTVTSPIPLFGKNIFLFSEGYYGKAFTGVLTRMSQSEQGEDEMVYVTKTGSVYHRSIACNHLKLSLRVVSIKELEEKRSFDGSIYYPCEKCCGGKNLSGQAKCRYLQLWKPLSCGEKLSENKPEYTGNSDFPSGRKNTM